MTDNVSFVYMPLMTFCYPSISLGLFKAILKRDGISSKVFYPNILFSEEILLPAVQELFGNKENFFIEPLFKIEDFLGNKHKINFLLSYVQGKFLSEWLFAPLVFSDCKDNTEWYIEYLSCDENFRRMNKEKLHHILLELRENSEKFLLKITEEIIRSEPSIVASSCMSQQYMPSLALFKKIKDLNPEIITLMGGPHCDSPAGLTTHKICPCVDYVVSGEADNIISPLVASILDKKKHVNKKDLHQGVFAPIHRKEGYPDRLRTVSPPSLEELPVPDYDDYFNIIKTMPELGKLAEPVLPLEGSRGCWWGEKKPCKFCSIYPPSAIYRSKSGGKILSEMEFLDNRYKAYAFITTDRIIDMNFFNTLIPELIKRGSPYRIFYEVYPAINREQIKLLCNAGIKWIMTGMESLHSEILKLINKGLKAWQNINFLKWCIYYRLNVGWNFLYDIPGAKDIWYEETAKIIPLLTHLIPPAHITPIHFEKGTVYHNNPDEYGLSLKASQAYYSIFPFSEDVIKDIAFYFVDERQVDRQNDEMDDLLNYGLNMAKKEIRRWQKLSLDDKKPVLKMTEKGKSLFIEDTRPCAVKASFILEGLLRDIYLACEEIPLKDNIIKVFKDIGVKDTEFIKALEKLFEWKLIIEIDDRLLSLAIRDNREDNKNGQ